MFLGAGFAQAVNAVLQTKQGFLIDISRLADIIWRDLLRDTRRRFPFSTGEAWIALLAIAGFCLFLLMKKIRANEVVR